MEKLISQTNNLALISVEATIEKIGEECPKPVFYQDDLRAVTPKARYSNLWLIGDNGKRYIIPSPVFAYGNTAPHLKPGLKAKFIMLKDRRVYSNKHFRLSTIIGLVNDDIAVNDWQTIRENQYRLIETLGYFSGNFPRFLLFIAPIVLITNLLERYFFHNIVALGFLGDMTFEIGIILLILFGLGFRLMIRFMIYDFNRDWKKLTEGVAEKIDKALKGL